MGKVKRYVVAKTKLLKFQIEKFEEITTLITPQEQRTAVQHEQKEAEKQCKQESFLEGYIEDMINGTK